jgi:2-methylcitrate dehydratase PrpD
MTGTSARDSSSAAASMETTPTQRLAAAAAAFTADTLPLDTLESAKDCLLDHIAVSLYGMQQPWTGFVADMVASDGGAPQSSVYGRGLRVPAQAAALVNGTAAHGFELDDWHAGSLSHLGAAVIPAVLAVAERDRLSGRDVLAAIVAGYEVMARAGMSGIPSIIERGYHPTGTHGPIGAAGGVGNLLRVSPEVMTAALGIGASCAGGLMEFSQDESGTMVKRVHAGRAAQAGVVAVDLAQRGVTAPRASLDGKYGYCRVLSDEPNPDALWQGLGEDFEIRRNNVKPYACCGMLHAPMDAVRDLMKAHGFTHADVDDIVIGGSRVVVEQHASIAPDSVMAAQYSMPYAAAVALLGRSLDPRMFDEGSYRDPLVLGLTQRIKLEIDPVVEAAFPGKLAGSARIRLKDGRKFETRVIDARGTTDNPFGREGIIAKARALCEGLLPPGAVDHLVERVYSFDNASDAGALVRLLDPPLSQRSLTIAVSR